MFRNVHQWVTSKRGSKLMSVIAAVGCSAGACVYLVPQGLFLHKCVEWFQLHKDGFPVPISKSLEDKGKQVLKETSLTQREKDLIKFFNVYGFDVYHLGTISTRQGAAIGIPKMYSFVSTDDVDQTEIQVGHNSDLSWGSQAGNDLKESLVLSENAQKFAIAKEIYRASYPVLHIHGIGTAAIMFAVSQVAQWGNRRFNLFKHPFKVRAVWYMVNCLLGWTLWISLTDMSNVYFDEESDKKAASVGKDYASGGVEYYQKKMQQNRALRTLMGERGPKFYTAHGNYYTLFRNKSMPLSQRLDIMKLLQKESQEDAQSSL